MKQYSQGKKWNNQKILKLKQVKITNQNQIPIYSKQTIPKWSNQSKCNYISNSHNNKKTQIEGIEKLKEPWAVEEREQKKNEVEKNNWTWVLDRTSKRSHHQNQLLPYPFHSNNTRFSSPFSLSHHYSQWCHLLLVPLESCDLQRTSLRRIRTSATDTSRFKIDRKRNSSRKWGFDHIIS